MDKDNLYRQYMLEADPTEYRFAIKYLGTWKEWLSILKDKSFEEEVNLWREELKVKLKSEALSRIIEASKNDTRDALQACKYLVELTLDKEDKRKIGRPSNESIRQEAQRMVNLNEKIKENHLRIVGNDHGGY